MRMFHESARRLTQRNCVQYSNRSKTKIHKNKSHWLVHWRTHVLVIFIQDFLRAEVWSAHFIEPSWVLVL